MSYPLPLEQLERLRSGTRRLAQQAATNESDLELLLGTAQSELRDSEATLSLAAGSLGPVGPVCDALRNQITRQTSGIEVVRRICIRARQHQLSADRLVSELAHPEAPAPLERPRHAVLVVDDSRDSREQLSAVLAEAGFLVRTAANGLEAVLAAYEIQPTVIVMDLMMPVLDGVEATRLIKAIDELRNACVIAYTATPRGAGQRAATLFTAVLQKPTAPDVIVATVQHYASRVA